MGPVRQAKVAVRSCYARPMGHMPQRRRKRRDSYPLIGAPSPFVTKLTLYSPAKSAVIYYVPSVLNYTT